MKHAILLLSLPLMILVSCTKEKIVGSNDLPAISTSFIAGHFPDQSIIHAVREYDDLRIKYIVYLKNGIKIEFNQSGEVQEIESSSALPETVIPTAVLHYVNENYPPDVIIKWKIERSVQSVKLSGGITLEFDKNGNFLRIIN